MMTHAMAALLAATLSLPVFARAETAEPRAGSYCQMSAARIAQGGYSGLCVIDAGKRLLGATDPKGVPVILTLHPRNGSIQSWQPVRFGGR
ncbi:hypothetical protein [Limimaricola pyoseonensis]|uniref:Hemolysin n=1 Tax=Limimaricola pyoseonensis TaxID=521013 RepID=A0A1G7EH75_9RHOB|nr:hypothetical protein [Limimaricola pyoseonensis]SDE62993.1 hypothetical protein SAMN04488567_2160 [Limimaricola pyoseonensis]